MEVRGGDRRGRGGGGEEGGEEGKRMEAREGRKEGIERGGEDITECTEGGDKGREGWEERK
jgi:hypothetical protein